MPLSFPSNPTVGQTYTAPNGFTYTWNGVTWTATSGGGGGGGGGGSPITVQNHGQVVTTSTTIINFTGTNIVTTGSGNAVTVSVNTSSMLANGTYTFTLMDNGPVALAFGAVLQDDGKQVSITPINTLSNYSLQIVPSPGRAPQDSPTPNDIHLQAADSALGVVLGTNFNNRSYVSVAGSDGSNLVNIGTYNTATSQYNWWWFATTGQTEFPGGYIFPATSGTFGQILALGPDNVTLQWTTSSATGNTLHYWSEANTIVDNSQTAITSLVVSGTQTNIDAVIQARGAGASLADSSGNKRGAYATDWQKQRGNNSQVASGDYSVIGGGSFNQATALHSVVVGGNYNVANSNYATVVGGNHGSTRGITGAVVFPGFATGGVEATPGVMQSAIYNIGAITTNNVPRRLSTDGSPTPTVNNQIGIGDRSTMYFRGTVIAKEDVASNADIWTWTFEGVLRQDVGSTTTDYVPAGTPPVTTLITNTTTSANLVLDLDNVLGTMIVQAVGVVGKTIRWSGKIETVELTDNN